MSSKHIDSTLAKLPQRILDLNKEIRDAMIMGRSQPTGDRAASICHYMQQDLL